MTPVIKWVVVLALVAVTVITVVTVIINHTMEFKRIPEDEKITEITSAEHLMGRYDSVSVWENIQNGLIRW